MSHRLPSACPLGAGLWAAWQQARQEFSEAAKRVTKHSGQIPKAEHDRLRQEVERTKLAADNAYVFLDLHRAQHGC